jgi:hypothetical protein
VKKYTFASNDTYVSGEQTTYAADGATVKASDYPYLSTGDLSTGDSKWDASVANEEKVYNANMPTLYSLPNDNVDNNATFLVVKGKFSYNGKNDETVYYPFYMNYNTTDASAPDGGTAKALHPNINYQVSITITGKGTNSPVTPVSSKTASVNVTVKNFVDAEQEYHDVAGAESLADVQAEDVGKVITSAGYIYDKVSDATAAGETAIAMIAYVGSNTGNSTYNHGLAVALKDAGSSNWSGATSTATSYSVAVPSTGTSGWFHGSKDQWTTIMGGTNGYNGTLNPKMTACGGTALSGGYWSSSENGSDDGWLFGGTGWSGYNKSVSGYVRSCLAF